MTQAAIKAAARPSNVRWAVLAWLCLAATIAYIQRQSLSVVEKEIREELRVDKDVMGWVLGSFFVTYAFFQIPAGSLTHYFGTRWLLPLMSALWSAATALFMFAQGAYSLFACRLLMGVGQAGMFTCTTVAVRNWFPLERRALANGAIASFMQVGSLLGAVITANYATEMGWRQTFLVFAIPGFLWALGFALWFRDRPGDHAGVNALERALLDSNGQPADGKVSQPVPWLTILTCMPLAWICLQQFCRAAAAAFYSSWFTTFLKEAHGVKLEEAGLLTALPIAAAIAGPLAGGWACDRVFARTRSTYKSRQVLSFCCLAVCVLLVLVAHRFQNVPTIVAMFSASSFLAAAAGPAAYTITIDIGGRHVAAVFSVMNMWGNIGALLFAVVVPRLIGKAQTTNWDPVFLLCAGIYLVAAIAWLPFDASRALFASSPPGRPPDQ